MQKLNLRVDMHVRDKAEFIPLCDDIGNHDLELGDKSPIKDLLDTNKFRKDTGTAKTMFAQTNALHDDGEIYTEKAYILIGVYKGQDSRTPNTLYSGMNRIKSILLDFYFNNYEELQKFGFTVVQGKKGYNVRLPSRSAYVMLKAAKKCVARHIELGKDSPLVDYDMKTFEKYGKEADGYINYANKYHDDAEAISEKLNNLLGFAKEQSIRTKGTLYNRVGLIRDFLLVLYSGQEKQIEDWGFKIIISTNKKKKEEEGETN